MDEEIIRTELYDVLRAKCYEQRAKSYEQQAKKLRTTSKTLLIMEIVWNKKPESTFQKFKETIILIIIYQ